MKVKNIPQNLNKNYVPNQNQTNETLKTFSKLT